MSTPTLRPAPTQPGLSEADRTAHDLTLIVRAPKPATHTRIVLARFPAGGPRGSWPAEEFAGARRMEGQPAEVVMDLASDAFLVIVRTDGLVAS